MSAPAEKRHRGVFASRCINRYILRGRWETVCGRAHRERWIIAEFILDCCFAWRERDHCRALHEWESGRCAQDRLRWASPRAGGLGG